GDQRGRERREFSGNTRVINRQQPRAVRRHAGDPYLAACRGRAVAQPAAALDAAFEPEPVVPCRLLRLGAHDETGRILRRDHWAAAGRASCASHAARTTRAVRYSPQRAISFFFSTRKVSDG